MYANIITRAQLFPIRCVAYLPKVILNVFITDLNSLKIKKYMLIYTTSHYTIRNWLIIVHKVQEKEVKNSNSPYYVNKLLSYIDLYLIK